MSLTLPPLLTHEPPKDAALVDSVDLVSALAAALALSTAGAAGAGEKYLVVDEYWSLFGPMPSLACFGPKLTPRYRDRAAPWQLLVHGASVAIQAFWEQVCVAGRLDEALGLQASREFLLVDETTEALVLHGGGTLEQRDAVQAVLEAQHPGLSFDFSWLPENPSAALPS